MAELKRLIADASTMAGGYRNLARRTHGLVSHSTLNNIVNGRHSGRLEDGTVRGIALAVERPAAEIARLAGVVLTDDLPPFVLPARAHRLSQPQRRVVLSVVDAILTAGDAAQRQAASGRPEVHVMFLREDDPDVVAIRESGFDEVEQSRMLQALAEQRAAATARVGRTGEERRIG